MSIHGSLTISSGLCCDVLREALLLVVVDCSCEILVVLRDLLVDTIESLGSLDLVGRLSCSGSI